MDALDVQIIRAMSIVPFGAWPHSHESLKPSYLAQSLGVTADRVLDRIRGMEQDKVLLGYDAQPNPRAFGLDESTFHVHLPPESKAGLLDELWKVEGVFGLYDYLGENACVQVFFRDDKDRQAKLAALTKVASLSTHPGVCGDRQYPAVKTPPSPLDLRVLSAMRGNARASPAELAPKVGVSSRTVKRRIDAMAKAGLFDVYAWVNLGAVSGRVPVELSLHFPKEKEKAIVPAAMKIVHDSLIYRWVPPNPAYGSMELLLLPPSTARAEAMRRELGDLPGMARAEALVPAGSRYSGTWLQAALDSAVRAAGPAA